MKNILSISILFVGFCVCISSGYLISSVILSLNTSTSVSVEAQTVYAISLTSGENESEIETQKEYLQSQSGAGYVYEENETFHLIASVYENKSDAELVKNNLSASGVTSEILSIQLSASTIEGNFTTDEKTILESCLKINIELFKKLYDVAISVDTNVLDTTKAKLECNQIYSSFISIRTNFETLFDVEDMDEIENNLTEIENYLSNLIAENYEYTSQTFSSLIKLTYCKILFVNLK